MMKNTTVFDLFSNCGGGCPILLSWVLYGYYGTKTTDKINACGGSVDLNFSTSLNFDF